MVAMFGQGFDSPRLHCKGNAKAFPLLIYDRIGNYFLKHFFKKQFSVQVFFRFYI